MDQYTLSDLYQAIDALEQNLDPLGSLYPEDTYFDTEDPDINDSGTFVVRKDTDTLFEGYINYDESASVPVGNVVLQKKKNMDDPETLIFPMQGVNITEQEDREIIYRKIRDG